MGYYERESFTGSRTIFPTSREAAGVSFVFSGMSHSSSGQALFTRTRKGNFCSGLGLDRSNSHCFYCVTPPAWILAAVAVGAFVLIFLVSCLIRKCAMPVPPEVPAQPVPQEEPERLISLLQIQLVQEIGYSQGN